MEEWAGNSLKLTLSDLLSKKQNLVTLILFEVTFFANVILNSLVPCLEEQVRSLLVCFQVVVKVQVARGAC